MHVGEALQVSSARERGSADDPLLNQIERQLKLMIEGLGNEAAGAAQSFESTPDSPAAATAGKRAGEIPS
jgi:hypothetical protein